MAHHLVCIELRDAPGYDYAKLHKEMEVLGFLPTYGSLNATYQLPLGIYYKQGDQAAADVLDTVRHAVRKALKDERTLVKAQNHFPLILVSELKAFDGLPTIKVPKKAR